MKKKDNGAILKEKDMPGHSIKAFKVEGKISRPAKQCSDKLWDMTLADWQQIDADIDKLDAVLQVRVALRRRVTHFRPDHKNITGTRVSHERHPPVAVCVKTQEGEDLKLVHQVNKVPWPLNNRFERGRPDSSHLPLSTPPPTLTTLPFVVLPQ